MEGGCHNAYLLAKLKISYDEIKKEIEKVASKKKTGQKNAESLLPWVDKLSLFSPDLGLLPVLLDCATSYYMRIICVLFLVDSILFLTFVLISS